MGSGDQMIVDLSKVEIYLRPGITDMRKQIAGLTTIAQETMELDPLSGALFLFCSRNRKLLKVVYWDRNGFCLWMKRLEKDKFPWPSTESQALQIGKKEIRMLLKGIDFFSAHQEIFYQEID
jgi:transposase